MTVKMTPRIPACSSAGSGQQSRPAAKTVPEELPRIIGFLFRSALGVTRCRLRRNRPPCRSSVLGSVPPDVDPFYLQMSAQDLEQFFFHHRFRQKIISPGIESQTLVVSKHTGGRGDDNEVFGCWRRSQLTAQRTSIGSRHPYIGDYRIELIFKQTQRFFG